MPSTPLVDPGGCGSRPIWGGVLRLAYILLVFVYVLWNWLAGAVVPGWTSLMAIMLLLGSAD